MVRGAQKVAFIDLTNFKFITYFTLEATMFGAELGIEFKPFNFKSRLFLLHQTAFNHILQCGMQEQFWEAQ